MKVTVNERLTLEVSPPREELLREPMVAQIVTEAEGIQRRLEAHIAELEGKLARLHRKLDGLEIALQTEPGIDLDEAMHRYVWGVRGEMEWNGERWIKLAKAPVG